MGNENLKNTVAIRQAMPSDSETLLGLLDELADYEKLDRPDIGARERIIRDAFSERPPFEVFLAETPDGAVVGYAMVLPKYSSFLALPTLYLEDIFVRPGQRSAGAGSALFAHVVKLADERGCGRVEFTVLIWNSLAREFYERRGVKHLDDWCFYRLGREDFGKVLEDRP